MFPVASTMAPEMAWTMPGRSLQTRVRTQWVRSVFDIRLLSLFGEGTVFAVLTNDADGYPHGY